MKKEVTRVVCSVKELPDPSARAFTIGTGEWPLKGFVVRQGDQVFAYLNRCPHAGHPLNLLGNDFFSPDQSLLMCKSHGACFEIATGLCVAGPCPGARLRSLALRIDGDDIFIVDDPDDLAKQFA